MEGKSLPNRNVSIYKDKRMWLSMIASVVSFVINLGISFYLTPFLIKNVGDAEYSFYPLATSFISYISIITVALNSMAGRFITISLHQKEYKKAAEYFSAVFYSSLIFVLILTPVSIVFIQNITSFINVPENLVSTVQILFSLVLFCLVVGQLGNVLTVATFYRDMLYLSSFATTFSHIVKVVVAIVLFHVLSPHVYYIGIANAAAALIVILFNFIFTKKLMPEIKLERKAFRIKAVFELIGAGIWHSITQLSNVLLNGLDLLIANRYLGPESVTMISVSKTMPNQLTALIASISSIFAPRLTREYAYNAKEQMVESLKSSIRLLGTIFCLPIGFLIACGIPFFRLWVPQLDATQLQILSVMGMGVLCLTASIQPIYSVFTITNKIKLNALVVLITGVLNVLTVFLLLQFFDDQVSRMYIIVGTSTVLGIVRNLAFTLPYSAYCIGIKKSSFFAVVFRSVFLLLPATLVYYLVTLVISPDSWIRLLLCAAVGTVLLLVVLWLFFMRKSEKQQIIDFIRKRKK